MAKGKNAMLKLRKCIQSVQFIVDLARTKQNGIQCEVIWTNTNCKMKLRVMLLMLLYTHTQHTHINTHINTQTHTQHTHNTLTQSTQHTTHTINTHSCSLLPTICPLPNTLTISFISLHIIHIREHSVVRFNHREKANKIMGGGDGPRK